MRRRDNVAGAGVVAIAMQFLLDIVNISLGKAMSPQLTCLSRTINFAGELADIGDTPQHRVKDVSVDKSQKSIETGCELFFVARSP